MLEYQRITGLVEDFGIFYADMVKVFYANFLIEPGCVLQSKIDDIPMCLTLDKLGACLNIPYNCEQILAGFTPDSPAWSDYFKDGYHFSIYRVREGNYHVLHAHT